MKGFQLLYCIAVLKYDSEDRALLDRFCRIVEGSPMFPGSDTVLRLL